MGISHGMGIPKIPARQKFPKLGNFPGILVWDIPGREKFETIREGGNGNFPLNIPGGRSLYRCSIRIVRTNRTSSEPVAAPTPTVALPRRLGGGCVATGSLYGAIAP